MLSPQTMILQLDMSVGSCSVPSALSVLSGQDEKPEPR